MSTAVTLFLAIQPLGCHVAATAPDELVALGETELYANEIVSREPPEQSWGAVPNPIWTSRLRRLYTEGCGGVVDIVHEWADTHGFAAQIGDKPSGRYGIFRVDETVGYFWISASWSRELHGTLPVAGYIIKFEFVFYSREWMSAGQRRRLESDYGIAELESKVIDEANACGRFTAEDADA